MAAIFNFFRLFLVDALYGAILYRFFSYYTVATYASKEEPYFGTIFVKISDMAAILNFSDYFLWTLYRVQFFTDSFHIHTVATYASTEEPYWLWHNFGENYWYGGHFEFFKTIFVDALQGAVLYRFFSYLYCYYICLKGRALLILATFWWKLVIWRPFWIFSD